MATTDFIAAIELGSSKIAGIAGKKNSDGSIQVLAYATEKAASCVHKGNIYNIEKTAQALSNIINKMEGQLKDATIAKVYVGVGGQALRTLKNSVYHKLEQEEAVTQTLIDQICDENRGNNQTDMDILEVEPQEYRIDSGSYAEPVGVMGQNVTGQFLNIMAKASIKKNIETCFSKAQIEIADLLIAPTAMAKATLSENEMRAGCALIDLGAETTTIVVYKNNILRYLAVLPLGSNNITRDIASLRMEEEEAELLKQKYGDLAFEDENEEETENTETCTLEDGRSIELSLLNTIIEARVEEILANVWNQIKLSGYEDKLLSGIVLTGGGANLKNLEKAFNKVCKTEKVKILKGVATDVHGFSEELKKDGTHNTLLGLLMAGSENCCKKEVEMPKPEAPKPVTPPQSNDMFKDDDDLKAQEEALRRQREKEEKKRKEEEEKRRKEKEKLMKEREKKKKESWLNSFVKGFFDDEKLN